MKQVIEELKEKEKQITDDNNSMREKLKQIKNDLAWKDAIARELK